MQNGHAWIMIRTRQYVYGWYSAAVVLVPQSHLKLLLGHIVAEFVHRDSLVLEYLPWMRGHIHAWTKHVRMPHTCILVSNVHNMHTGADRNTFVRCASSPNASVHVIGV